MKKLFTFLFLTAFCYVGFAQTDSVTFDVDLTYQIDAGLFDAATDYVDVAGSFNEWNGEGHHLTTGDNNIYSVTVYALDSASVIEYKYRFNGDWNTSEFPGGGANRKYTVRGSDSNTKDLYDNFRPGWVPVTVTVKMRLALDSVPDDYFVDLAGNFNGWGGSDELWDVDNDVYDSVYVGTVMAEMGVDMEFKTRINGSWLSDYHEFPDGGSNRVYSVVDTAGGVTNVIDPFWFNDEYPVSIKEISINSFSVYPNPFSNIAYIEYNLSKPQVVTLSIFNTLGQIVETINNVNSSAGKNTIAFDGSALSNGLYFYRIETDNDTKSGRIIKE